MRETLTSEERQRLVGMRLPEGRFTIDPGAHRVFCDAVFAPNWESPKAHPLYLHIVAHVGKGMALDEFFALIGTRLEAGVTFGQGRLDYHRPLRVGESYRIVSDITGVEPKQGRRKGRFDVVTVRSRVLDGAVAPVGTSTESYIVPNGHAG